MSWFADLAGKAENLLNNLDEQTGQALRNHTIKRPKQDKTNYALHPDGSWGQRTRRPTTLLRNSKKITSVTEAKSSFSPTRKQSPTNESHLFIKESPTHTDRYGLRLKKSPTRTKNPQFHLNNCPKTLVDDDQGDSEIMNRFSRRQRRHSVPSDLTLRNDDSDITIRMQNLEVENAMLKNELNVMNREVSQLLERLKAKEDELSTTRIKLEDSELRAHKANLDKDSLSSQLETLKEKIKEIVKMEQDYRGEKQNLLTENSLLKDANNYLEERIKDLTKKIEERDGTLHKLETDLRHAQSTISELHNNLDKSNGECQRLEKDWETYKLRVKSMLFAKDNEIKSLQDGLNLSEDTKVLMEQLESLKEERDELSEAISNVRSECDTMKLCLSQVESRHTAAERVVGALRDAIKEERAAKNRAEAQMIAISKELKNMQIETGQTIASLRTALRDKEAELNHVRETSSSLKTSDTSALNVADYDVTQDTTIENEKIQYLTETLVQRQGKVDKLIAENNMLKIQMDKLESKYKSEISQRPHIVNVQSAEHRSRRVPSDSLITILSHRMAAVIRRHPVLRILVLMYMICLHFWVVTVLLTSTPAENFIPRTSRS